MGCACGKSCLTPRRLRLLLASSSVAALLVGGGAPAAYAASAACAINVTAGTVAAETNAVAINCINIQGATVTGAITNSATGTITPTGTAPPTKSGITIDGASVGGGIVNAGTIHVAGSGFGILATNNANISGGISNSGTISSALGTAITLLVFSSFSGGINNTGTIAAPGLVGISVSGTNFSGGISNGGTITANFSAIHVLNVSTFAGGIINTNAITTAEDNGITVDVVSIFSGAISNNGTISTGGVGSAIVLSGISTVMGGIINSGHILSAAEGIKASSINVFGNGSVGGGITNSGTISSVDVGIDVKTVSTFAANISNSGTITGAGGGIVVTSAVRFGIASSGGGIVNSGVISNSGAGIVANNDGNFLGGMTNAGPGMIAADGIGMGVAGVTNFSGGISNAGSISVGLLSGLADGILVGNVTTFQGGITNTGSISSAAIGILVGFISSHSGVFPTQPVSTFFGNISNSGTIVAQTGIVISQGGGPNARVGFAGGAIVNSGDLTGTAGTAIDDTGETSPVVIDQTAGTITGAIKLSPEADVVNVSGGAIVGDIVGQGTSNTVNFALGAGNTFTYANNFSGIHQVNVTSGTVVLNGTKNSATGVTVSHAGTLAGTGTIAAAVAVNGTLQPGNPGTAGTNLAITGTLTFSNTAAYLDTIGTATASETNVTGTATLGDATVTVAPGSTVTGGTEYTILTDTGGGLGGGNTFNPTVTYQGVVGTLSYSADDVFLTFGATPAGCYKGPFPVSNSGVLSGICVINTTVNGSVGNAAAGRITTSGISVTNSTINGQIFNAGTLVGGISIDATSKVAANNTAVSITGPTFIGGITNAGLISSTSGIGILVGFTAAGASNVTQFSGGITNSGTISAALGGIILSSVVTFQNGITNTGTIVSGSSGIGVNDVSTFAGGIVNEGLVTAGGDAILVLGDSTFSGGISNGAMLAAGNIGVLVTSISNFSGGISNGGTITAAQSGIVVAAVSTFGGGISNSGTVSAGAVGIAVLSKITLVDPPAKITGSITNTGTISLASKMNLSFFAMGGITNAGAFTVVDTLLLPPTVTMISGITNSGTITARTGILIGTGVTFAAAPAIVNSGTISGTGGTAIDVSAASSAMTINQMAGAINGDIKLSANADVLNISGGAINGNIVGQGAADTINFAPSGSFSYAGNFTGINQVNINSGTVILNGSDDATTIAVNSGATLGGSGSLDPLTVTINNGATFAPGTPGVPGTSMTITGNLAFQPNAVYAVQVNPATASFATVSGTASLAGSVQASFASGFYVTKQYDILHAGTLNNTTFTALGTTGLPGNFTASLAYTPTDVMLDITATMGPSGLSGPFTINQQNVATTLNNYFNSGGLLTQPFLNIFGLTGTTLANALTRLDGEAAVDAEATAFQSMDEFLSLMLDPFVDGRNGWTGGGGQPLGFAPDQTSSFPADVALAYDAILKAPPPKPASLDQRWTAWGAAYGGSNSTNGDPAVVGSTSFTASTYGFAGGMDYHFSPDAVAGFAVAGGGSNWSLQQALGGGRSDAVQAGVYGTRYFGPAYLAGAAAFGNNWMTTNRIAFAGDQLTAQFDAQSYGVRLEGGYRYAVLPTLGVTPYAALQAQSFHTPNYSETDLTGGGFGLTYQSMTATDTRSELGARLDAPTVLNGMPLLLRGRVAWAHDWVSDPALTAVFQALPGASFVVNGAALPQNSALATAGAELRITRALTLIGKFDGEFASGSQTYAGSGTLRYAW